ncbi:MAG: hypothetical protein QOH31_6763 [Verrucomicrobiota bacterium]
MPERLPLCTINPAGFIETQDGARIRFNGRGYSFRSSEKYQTNLTLVFGTEDVRYEWLRKVVVVLEGEFDERTAGQLETFMFLLEAANDSPRLAIKPRMDTN